VNGTFASVVALASVLALGLGGCASQAEKPELAEAPATRSTGSYGAGTAGVQQESYADRPWDDPSSPLYRKVIYFDYDSSEIRSEFVPLLQTHAGYLANHPGTRVTLEGHTDERGTREYNLALGDERAQTVQRFMLAEGVRSDQLTTLSFGEEKPVALEHGDTAWSQNRRVELAY
jgi:peptidoglycan-associated lipoprotein